MIGPDGQPLIEVTTIGDTQKKWLDCKNHEFYVELEGGEVEIAKSCARWMEEDFPLITLIDKKGWADWKGNADAFNHYWATAPIGRSEFIHRLNNCRCSFSPYKKKEERNEALIRDNGSGGSGEGMAER